MMHFNMCIPIPHIGKDTFTNMTLGLAAVLGGVGLKGLDVLEGTVTVLTLVEEPFLRLRP